MATSLQGQVKAPVSFIHEDFLLTTKAARRLYHEFAEAEPILDYHCHLPPQDVADNRQFREPVRDLAGGRPLQMARHARQRRRRALLHRRRRRPTKNSWRGRAPCRTRCAIRCTTGRTWS